MSREIFIYLKIGGIILAYAIKKYLQIPLDFRENPCIMGFMKRQKYGSVKAMAEKLGVNRVYLSAVLTGAVQPSYSLAKKLTKITGRSFFDFRPDLKNLLKKIL